MSDFFESFSWDNLTFGEIAIGIVIVCAILAFFRGVFRQILGMICLLIGAAAGFYVFKTYDSVAEPYFGASSANTVLLVSVAVGFVVYLLLRLLTNLLIGTALFVAFAGLFGKGGGVGIVGALLSLIPSAALVWVTAMIARLTGAFGEFEQTNLQVHSEEGSSITEIRTKAPRLESENAGPVTDFIRSILDFTDPVASPNQRKLAQLLLLSEDEKAWHRLESDPRTFGLAKSPIVRILISRSDIQRMIEENRYDELLNSKPVAESAKHPSIKEALEEIDLRPIVEDSLYEGKVRRERRMRPRHR